ncbi:MAG: ferrous iron transporter B [Candidatus Caenarcaniphilales bacterium]|nr:ferrous iron transporter B [Candidatus Caenarcaniphilales bacterium]
MKDKLQPIQEKAKTKKIFLVGNPNVGKSALFQALSGQFVEISNYPGTTVEVLESKLFGNYSLVDTPGVYSISAFNDEERITQEALKQKAKDDFVVNVVNATTLQKDLFLTLQLIDLRLPFVLVVNQIDELEKKKIQINYEKLSTILGVKVFAISAFKNQGIQDLKSFLETEPVLGLGNQSPELRLQTSKVKEQNPTLNDFDCLMVLEESTPPSPLTGGEKNKNSVEFPLLGARRGIGLVGDRKTIYSKRRERVNRLLDQVLTSTGSAGSFVTFLDRFFVHPIYGSLFSFFIAFFFLYQVLGVWVAGDLVNLVEKGIFEKYWNPAVRWSVAQVLPVEIHLKDENKKEIFPYGMALELITCCDGTPNEAGLFYTYDYLKTNKTAEYVFSPADLIDSPGKTTELKQTHLSSLGTILAGKYGLLTLTITYLFGVLLPLVWFFYFSWSFLEDSGYLPRLAVLADGFLRKLGLNGRGIIPLVLGLGCVTMAVVTTRLMSNKREQLIMMILLAITVPCSAQLGIIQGLLAKMGGFEGWLIWFGVVILALICSGLIANKLIKGVPSPLILELPPLRLPHWRNVLNKTNQKSWFFLKESGVAFFWASLVVTFFQVTGVLTLIIDALKPLIAGVLHLPKEVSLSFLLGMVRRDFGAFGLLDLELTKTQVVTACVTLTLFVPCIATLGLMIKERNLKTALGIWFTSWIVGFSVGGLLTRLLEFINF